MRLFKIFYAHELRNKQDNGHGVHDEFLGIIGQEKTPSGLRWTHESWLIFKMHRSETFCNKW